MNNTTLENFKNDDDNYITYQVQWDKDNTYSVIKFPDLDEGYIVYTGSLADCEAYIRLKENGYM